MCAIAKGRYIIEEVLHPKMKGQMELLESGEAHQIPPVKVGGTRAVLFIYVMIGLENMAFLSNAVSLVIYFHSYMNFGLTKSANTLTNYLGTAFLLALFGGFISDTCLSRFHTCILFGCVEFLGYILLTIQAHFPSLRPEPCKSPGGGGGCREAAGAQAALLYTGLYMVALGTGGIKGALPVLGADQFDGRNPDDLPKLSSFFNWLLFSVTIGACVGVTLLVWISSNLGWEWSFGICTISVFLATVFLLMGRSFYRHNLPGGSPITGILQVFVAAARNRNLSPPAITDELHENFKPDKESAICAAETESLRRTDQFRFLDRAAIPPPPGDAGVGPWRLCTVTQVEQVKILLRMIPIMVSTVFMNVCLAQLQTFSIQQGATLDTSVAGGFRLPVSSLAVIPLAFISVLLPLYDRAFVPLARRLTGIPTGIRHLQRVGVGLVLSAISMAIAGAVECRRKAVARRHPAEAPLPMSVFWLGIQYGIFGAADMFTVVGLLEFFYAESSAGMRSLSTAISWTAIAMGYFGSTAAVEAVNGVSGGWLKSNDLNRDRLEYFYWLLAGLSAVNFGVYLRCASKYRYKAAEKVGI